MPEYSLKDLGTSIGLDIPDGEEIRVLGLASPEDAGPDRIAFAENERYLEQVRNTAAAAVLVPPDFPDVAGKRLWRVENPRLSFLRIAEMFVELPGCAGIHPDASIHPEAELGDGVSVGPCAVISAGARIGAGSRIDAGAFVDDGVEVGAGCRIRANVSLLQGVSLGERVTVHANTALGGDGFGYAWLGDHHHKIPQLGSVEVGDDVEIGCNCSVDRATLGVTRIGRGSKIDNLVHIAHNCHIGEHVILAGQVGFAGSVNVGSGAVLAGQVGVSDHINIGQGATIGGKSAVTRDIEPGTTVWGAPARPIKRVMKEQAAIGRLPELLKQMKAMQKELTSLRERLATREDDRVQPIE